MVYKTDKKPDEPCSITNSLTFFPDEEGGEQNATAAPRLPPTNLTVVTVEGCPSFVILDWEKSDNETRGTACVCVCVWGWMSVCVCVCVGGAGRRGCVERRETMERMF